MRFAKLAAAAAVLSMSATPVMAATAVQVSASKLSVANAQPVRTTTSLKKSSKAAPVVLILAVVAGVVGVGLATGVIGGSDS